MRARDDIERFVDVIYFRKSDRGEPTDTKLPTGLEPYASGFTLATIEEEMRSWSEEDREAFHVFLLRPEIIDLLKAAFSRALSAGRPEAQGRRRADQGRRDDGGCSVHALG